MVKLKFEPYKLPIKDEDLFKILNSSVPPKPWEPSVGDMVIPWGRPFKIYKDYGNGTYEACDDSGNCLTLTRKEIIKHFYSGLNKDFIMKAMKDAVLTVATTLAKANNSVTTLEIKNELRRDYPYYFWTQDVVSNFMSQLAGDGIFDYKDNGTYRIYSLVNVKPKKTSASATISKVAGTIPSKTSVPVTGKKAKAIKIATLLNYAAQNGFEGVTIDRKGNPIFYDIYTIRGQKKSPVGYISRYLDKVLSITVSGRTYPVK